MISTFTFELEPYDYYDLPPSHDIRTVTFADKPNDPWFVAADVCRALDLHASALRRLDDDQKLKLPRTQLGMRQGQPASLIDESGLYKLVMRSDKPEAKVFQGLGDPRCPPNDPQDRPIQRPCREGCLW